MSKKKKNDRDAKLAVRNERVANFRSKIFEEFSMHIYKTERERPLKQKPKVNSNKATSDVNVGIVGGGMTGMYASLLLSDLGIGHRIFEASDSRLGGRVFTKYFNNLPYQYAELGAMRFPHNQLQTRLFNFWNYLNDTVEDVPGAEEIEKIPYILYDETDNQDAGNLLCYNGMPPVTRNEAALDNALLGFDQFFVGPEWDYFKDENGQLKSASTLLDAALEPFISLLENENIYRAWEEILKYNSYSARGYLQEFGDGVKPYPIKIVNYLETALTYTGVYDLSFIELILDSYSFDYTGEWSAMNGGTSRITDEMHNRIPTEEYTTDRQVVKLSEEDGKGKIHYRIGDANNEEVQEFDRVIVTVPFSVLRFIDTPSTWSAGKYEAIRSLKMTNAVKVTLGFKSRFWEKDGVHSQGMAGGQSNTDLPSRSIVYPSFGIGEAGPAYLLSSYSWQDDADKCTHLTKEQMFEATLKDVIRLHGEVAREEYLGDGDAIVWNTNRLAGGGFEFFAAAQFGEMFVNAREPEGAFNFGGEHLDMVHYWIAGSFNSAFRTVWEILIQEGLDTQENLKTLFTSLGGGSILPTMIPQFSTHTVDTVDTMVKQWGVEEPAI